MQSNFVLYKSAAFTQLINVKPKSVFFQFQTVLASLLTLREIVTKYARISCILPVCNFRGKNLKFRTRNKSLLTQKRQVACLMVRSLMYSFSEYIKEMTYDVIPPSRATHVLSAQRETRSRYVVGNIIGVENEFVFCKTSHHYSHSG